MTNNAIKLELAVQMLSDKLYNHSFMVRCRQGTITLAELQTFLLQHGLYSSYFTRYLCAMMASLPANSQVLALAENLFE